MPGLGPRIEPVVAAEYNANSEILLQEMIARDGMADEFCRAVDDIVRNS